MLANVARAGSGALRRKLGIGWQGFQGEGLSALGGTPKAQKVVVVLELFTVGPPVSV